MCVGNGNNWLPDLRKETRQKKKRCRLGLHVNRKTVATDDSVICLYFTGHRATTPAPVVSDAVRRSSENDRVPRQLRLGLIPGHCLGPLRLAVNRQSAHR